MPEALAAVDEDIAVVDRRTIMRLLSPMWLALAIMLVGLAARLYNLDARSFWEDEVTQAHVARFSTLEEAFNYTHAYPDVMPLMNVITWLLRVFGSNEWVVRLPAAIAGGLSVFAIYLLGSKLGGARVGLVAALLLAVSPREVWYGQEARPYTILLLLAMLQMLFAYRTVVQGRKLDWLWFALSTIVSLYTHYLALATTASALAFIGLVLAAELAGSLRQARRQPSAESRAGVRQVASKMGLALASLGVVAFGYLPWLPYLGDFLGRGRFGFGRFEADYAATIADVKPILDYWDVSGLVLALVVVGIVALAIRMAGGQWKEGALILIWAGLPLMAFWLRLQEAIVTVWPRYFVFLHPAVLLLAAWGVDGLVAVAGRNLARVVPEQASIRLPVKRVMFGAALLVLLAEFVPALTQSYAWPKSDYRGAAQYLTATSPPDSVVIGIGPHSPSLNWGLRYYFWRFNSTIAHVDAVKLEDLAIARIEKSAGDVWVAVTDDDPIAPNLREEEFEIKRFTEYIFFRRASTQGTPLAQASDILRWSSTWHPELVSAAELIDVWSGAAQPGVNVLPQASTAEVEGWSLSQLPPARAEDNAFVLTPGGAEAQATWSTKQVAAGERYIFQFEYRNPQLTGRQSVHVYAYRADGAELNAFPTSYGHPCDPSVEWNRGMFALTLPEGTASVVVKLAARGTGKAEFRGVSMWRVSE
ncbi:MAG TPA: glycosyltransferase family 39 protein [Chloroflexia bacterium]|nr:glycosyltransferase family 39 protein [Chloroflexia bacterium]